MSSLRIVSTETSPQIFNYYLYFYTTVHLQFDMICTKIIKILTHLKNSNNDCLDIKESSSKVMAILIDDLKILSITSITNNNQSLFYMSCLSHHTVWTTLV
ncbi:hypothetical protein ACKWTF_000083 [Chironomus riparius]